MTKLKDYNELVDELVLPINGVEYTLPLPKADFGVKFQLAKTPGTDVTMEDEEFYAGFLGDELQRMRDNGVTPAQIQRVALVAVADFERDRATAVMLWETGSDPKAQQEYQERGLTRDQRRSIRKVAARTTK
jgi:hypothetical protein